MTVFSWTIFFLTFLTQIYSIFCPLVHCLNHYYFLFFLSYFYIKFFCKLLFSFFIFSSLLTFLSLPSSSSLPFPSVLTNFLAIAAAWWSGYRGSFYHTGSWYGQRSGTVQTSDLVSRILIDAILNDLLYMYNDLKFNDSKFWEFELFKRFLRRVNNYNLYHSFNIQFMRTIVSNPRGDGY